MARSHRVACEYAQILTGRRATGFLWRVQGSAEGLTDSSDAGQLHNWRLFLPRCECNGLLMIRVHAGKSLAIFVKQRHLPVVVLPPLV